MATASAAHSTTTVSSLNCTVCNNDKPLMNDEDVNYHSVTMATASAAQSTTTVSSFNRTVCNNDKPLMMMKTSTID